LAEFTNPNQPGGQNGQQGNSSLFIMMIVMVGVIFGLQYWKGKHAPPPAPSPATTQSAATAAPQAVLPPIAAAVSQAASGTATTPAIQGTAAAPIVVENDLYRITFSTQGAQATSWILKKYKNADGQPLDMIQQGGAQHFGLPLSLYTYDHNLNVTLASAIYVASQSGSMQAPGSLVFRYQAGGVNVTKTFRFEPNTYVIHAETEVQQNGGIVRAALSWPAGLGDMETAASYTGAQIDTESGGHTDHVAYKKVSGGNTLAGPLDWAGTSDQYFASIFLPDQPQSATLITFHDSLMAPEASTLHGTTGPGVGLGDFQPVPADGKAIKGDSLYPFLGSAIASTSGITSTSLFVGPKAVGVLKSVKAVDGSTLEPLLDFGFFGFIGKYLFLSLRAIHGWLAPSTAVALTPRDWSWGWAILLLTVIINLLILPLRVQGMKSAVKMRRIQPQMDAIKKRFGNPGPTSPKQAEMNQEIMALQKQQGVSMFGGCVPTLIQLPLLFAFFTMLTRVVELRQAHWGWLHDLSAADPYHILPILMVLTSFLVQYMTPSPGVDPAQQKMMAFTMPLFSGFITWNYASGLALYWVMGNLIMIGQQLVMNNTAMGKEMKELAKKPKTPKIAAPATRTIQGKR
jgi:YidC/Oxa1 family membrane protein insertase